MFGDGRTKDWRKYLRRVVGWAILLVPLSLLYMLSDTVWVEFANLVGLDPDHPPIILIAAFAFLLGFANKFPIHSSKTIEIQSSQYIEAPVDMVWTWIRPQNERSSYLPFVQKVESIDGSREHHRHLMTYFDGAPNRSKTSRTTIAAEKAQSWLRIDFERTSGLPAWDSRMAWMAWNLVPEGEGTRVQLTKAIDRPKVWAGWLLRVFNTARYELLHLAAACQGDKKPVTLFDFWIDQYQPEASSEYVATETEAYAFLGDNMSGYHRWVIYISLGLPIVLMIGLLTLLQFKA